MDAYLDELEFRFGNRDNPHMFRDAILQLIQAECVTYSKLTA